MAINTGLFLGKGTWKKRKDGQIVAVFETTKPNMNGHSECHTVSYKKETLESLLDHMQRESRRTAGADKNVDYHYAMQTLEEYPVSEVDGRSATISTSKVKPSQNVSQSA